MPNFHKTCLKGKYIGIYTSRYVALFIEKACNLQELTLYWYRLKGTYGCVYESAQILRIEKSLYYPGFFSKLAISFSNLKELHLDKFRMFDSDGSFRDMMIDLGDLNLQKLSFTANEALNSSKIPIIQLVCVEIKRRRQYIKVCTGGIPKTITNEEGAAVWKRVAARHTHLIMRSAPAHFKLNNVYIELMI